MKKKYVQITLAVLLTISIGINFYQYFDFKEIISAERNRLYHSTSMINLFTFPFESLTTINREIDEHNPNALDSSIIQAIDSTLYGISDIKEDLVAFSGGYDVNTGFPVNPDKVGYVNSYFYENNSIRPFAINDFKAFISYYLNTCDSLNKESTLSRRVELYNQFLDEDILINDFFYGLSVGEAVILIKNMETILFVEESKFISVEGK